jgi:hypothetical protein
MGAAPHAAPEAGAAAPEARRTMAASFWTAKASRGASLAGSAVSAVMSQGRCCSETLLVTARSVAPAARSRASRAAQAAAGGGGGELARGFGGGS